MTNIMPATSGATLALLLAPAADWPRIIAAPATTTPPVTAQAGAPQILGWRANLQARPGKDCKLLRFHHQFMQQGCAPLASVRAALLHDHSPTL